VPEGEARGLLSAAAGVPLHRQLFLVLHDEIVRGALDPGDPLPTEQALCDQFGVSRITVRRALADLSDEGLIQRKHGVGSFVLDGPSIRQRDLGGTYMDGMRQVGFETEVEVLEYDERGMPRAVAELLGQRERVLYSLRLRRARLTAEPLMYTEVWLPLELADVVTERTLVERPLFQLLADAGIEVERVDHEMTAEIAGPRAAQLLGTPIGSPLIRVNRVPFVNGAPHHVMSMTLSPNRSRVIINYTAEQIHDGSTLSIAHDVRSAIL
jgi:GntR family transcriptional regulator